MQKKEPGAWRKLGKYQGDHRQDQPEDDFIFEEAEARRSVTRKSNSPLAHSKEQFSDRRYGSAQRESIEGLGSREGSIPRKEISKQVPQAMKRSPGTARLTDEDRAAHEDSDNERPLRDKNFNSKASRATRQTDPVLDEISKDFEDLHR